MNLKVHVEFLIKKIKKIKKIKNKKLKGKILNFKEL
jgi:hypothetical protein